MNVKQYHREKIPLYDFSTEEEPKCHEKVTNRPTENLGTT